MDYPATTSSEVDNGIFYNSQKPIGGIRYYARANGSVIVDKIAKQVVVNLDKKQKRFSRELEEEPIAEKVAEAKEIITLASVHNELIEKQRTEQFKKEQADREEKRLAEISEKQKEDAANSEKVISHYQKAGVNYRAPYLVSVNGTKVNFSDHGISRPSLSRRERAWLAKAQKYFITARDHRGKLVGSAKEYTSIDALEALWATAEHTGVDPKRFIVQMYNETRFNPNLRGKAGERGLGQFKRTTAQMLGYDWRQMLNGEEGYAYQARCAAEFVRKVGESKYNGGNPAYVQSIDKKLEAIDDVSV